MTSRPFGLTHHLFFQVRRGQGKVSVPRNGGLLTMFKVASSYGNIGSQVRAVNDRAARRVSFVQANNYGRRVHLFRVHALRRTRKNAISLCPRGVMALRAQVRRALIQVSRDRIISYHEGLLHRHRSSLTVANSCCFREFILHLCSMFEHPAL